MTPGARALLGVCVALVACSGAGKRESGALIDAVDRYRHADDATRVREADLVGRLPCSVAEVCEAKRVCVEAIAPTTRALALKEEVTARLTDVEQKRLDPGSPEAAALPEKLDEASRLLTAGRSKMTECERRLADLRAHY